MRRDWDLQSLARLLGGFSRTEERFGLALLRNHDCLHFSMTRPFNNARLKINRAHEHLKALETKATRFWSGEKRPYPVRYQFNAKRTECRFYISVAKKLPQDKWGPIIGDCTHNARSALDHLVWEMSECFTGPEPSDTETQFPIFSKPELFAAHAGRRIRRLPVYAQALVEQLQPYHALSPMEHPLWMCRDLDDTDKHKLIPVVAAVIQGPGVAASSSRPPIIDANFTLGPFEDGAEIGFVRFASPVGPKMKMHTYFTIVESLSDVAPNVDSRHTLRHILHHVTRVIDAFNNFPNHRSVLLIPSP